ncbi:MAG: hypothetical protein HQL33_07020 [Alphaproteobacteria bacterium]|nr:hypothetical protein [Alphaproteobacteria bacterium]MBF0129727.1 hypothetical protein [Alphaproteobacteria bacterium]
MKRQQNLTVRVVGLSVTLAAFAAVVGVFSSWPVYEAFPHGLALIKVSLAVDGVRTAACRERTPEELAKLSPNMRTKTVCQRERAPVVVELVLDGRPALSQVAAPAGLSRDGASNVYQRFPVPAGTHKIALRMRNTPREAGYDFVREETVTLKPAQVLAVTFDRQREIFVFQ